VCELLFDSTVHVRTYIGVLRENTKIGYNYISKYLSQELDCLHSECLSMSMFYGGENF